MPRPQQRQKGSRPGSRSASASGLSPVRRVVRHKPDAASTRKRKSQAVHTLSLLAASLTGATQFAGVQPARAADHISYAWNGTRMAAQRAGTPGGTRVIFIHGTPGSAGAWEAYLADVPQDYEYIAVDRAGFGQSGPTQAVTSLEQHARALAPLLADETHPAIVVGHSLGAPVAAMLGVLFPTRMRALVMVAGAFDPALEKVHVMQSVGNWWGVRHLLPRALRNANHELLALRQELTSLAPRLASLAMPVEIVHGTDDNLTPFQNVPFMEAHMKNAPLSVTVLEGQNHFLPWNAKPEIDMAIARAAQAGAHAAQQDSLSSANFVHESAQ